MRDCRENLFNEIFNMFIDKVEQEELYSVKNTLLLIMDKYEIIERSTELAVVDNSSNQYLKMWLTTIYSEGKSKSTIKHYKSVVGYLINEVDKPIAELTSMEIRAWLAKRNMAASKRTVSNYRNVLSSFYKWLYEEGVIDVNPMVRVKTIKYTKKVKNAFSDVDIDTIRHNCTHVKQRALVEVLLSTGVRANEFCNIMISDVNFNKQSILVREGKGSKERVVYFDDVCHAHLKKYLEYEKRDSIWLFRKRGGGQMSVENVEGMVRNLGRKCDIKKCHPHKFRTTFATNAYRNGVDVHTIQKLMGHENIQTTMGYIMIDDSSTYFEYRKHCG